MTLSEKFRCPICQEPVEAADSDLGMCGVGHPGLRPEPTPTSDFWRWHPPTGHPWAPSIAQSVRLRPLLDSWRTSQGGRGLKLGPVLFYWPNRSRA